MSIDLKIKKGLRLKLKGEAEKILSDAPRSKSYAIKPADFHSVVPKMVVKEGAKVLAGDELFFSKYSDTLRFTSPVSGTVKEIVRGEKRRVLSIIIEADAQNAYKDFGKVDLSSATGDEIKNHIFKSGCGAFIIQRPYDIVANAEDTPKSIVISTYNSAPLAADLEFVLKNKQEAFQAGITALSKLTPGKVYLGVEKNTASYLADVADAEIVKIKGPHPAGNVGTIIHKVDPINPGERVWTIGAEDVATIGNLFLTGNFKADRTIAVVGSEAHDPKYYHGTIGMYAPDLVGDVSNEVRLISGDVFTGDQLSAHDYVGFYDNELTLIPEGNNYRMFGWMPFKDNHIHSNSPTSLAWLFPNKKYAPDTNLNGEERALVVTGEMEEVMPMDIYPMQLLKACMAGDIEKMENLGIYEVAPEDFALVDYVNTSKLEAQEVIRTGLDLMITEVG
ncbi:Na(+)-translocating NADH-quinone reductase subunit A [Gangjinia marincola]|uniref:Na(+)-translocating NADH-quinone reductase subunit A n=1 Tax=Gangjinia marincola TaxID=578463 RepID=A0ABN1MJ39_9FLAO